MTRVCAVVYNDSCECCSVPPDTCVLQESNVRVVGPIGAHEQLLRMQQQAKGCLQGGGGGLQARLRVRCCS